MIQFEEYKSKLNNLKPALITLRESLNIEAALNELERLHAMQEAPGFWDDPAKSQTIVKKTHALENKVSKYEKMCAQWDDLMTIIEMALEEGDDSMLDELTEGYASLEHEMEVSRLETLLTGDYDSNNAIVSFQAGAGGTEAQDWTQMLYRMYTRWVEAHGLSYKILDYLDGDEAGIKSASILVEGENAYGFLKSENGVHRLVRVSPFDANARRQTSFSAVEVIPEIADDSNDVEIRQEDIEMQVFRSSGAGGQHINKTSSAVRLIHKPTGIVVACQTQRDQFQNKETCMRMLRSKLVEIKEREHLEKISDIKGTQQKIEWGSQIRNYVFMPYTLAKDTRTGYEMTNINAVMDGDLDGFINAYLTCAATGTWVTK
ncbi:MAG: peptide chain release factor 2 [Ruminococcaceae bacterium]|nr:peptide chain release factor 2 [Oscillospiraceae bacterium]